MAFRLSPGIDVREVDLTSVVPAVATTEAAIAGPFKWGPVHERVLVSSEVDLVSKFRKPTSFNAETFFTAADFLAYSNALYVTRTASSDSYNAGTANAQIISQSDADSNTDDVFIARWPGDLGNSLKVAVCANTSIFSETYANTVTINSLEIGSNTINMSDTGNLEVGDILRLGNDSIGKQDLEVTSVANTAGANGYAVEFSTSYKLADDDENNISTIERKWGFYDKVNGAPSSANNFHLIVVDEDGDITGTKGAILETWENLNTNSSAKDELGNSTYYKDVLEQSSNWLWATGSTINLSSATTYTSLTGGTDGDNESTMSLADYAKGYDKYITPEEIDVSFILQGKAIGGVHSTQLANYIVDNVCEVRKDCIAFISPDKDDVVNNSSSIADAVVEFRNNLNSSSYAFMDSGYKYRYDKYNDVYRWVPMNGDTAGLSARTDANRDAWFSPAGYNRGIIKNVAKLAWNPNRSERDILYKNDVNPIIQEQGAGTLLYGDKTLLGRTSAFDRINVRRLFIVLEKAISVAAKSTLFEFNDEFTRASFKNLVEPFLRDVQGRRGIYDFRVVADGSNNTAEVIDRNEFVGDIYVRPSRSINFIRLNFVAVRSGVEFDEIVGQF